MMNIVKITDYTKKKFDQINETIEHYKNKLYMKENNLKKLTLKNFTLRYNLTNNSELSLEFIDFKKSIKKIDEYPKLNELSRKYENIPFSNAAVKRSFSIYKDILADNRKNMQNDRLELKLLCRYNKEYLNKYF